MSGTTLTTGDQKGTVLSSDAEFKGSLTFRDNLLVNGKFDGEITGPGVVQIGTHGEVKAEINVGSAVVEGRVQGNITAKDKIELRTTTRMNGNIKASRLIIQEGVVFVGNCEVNPTEGKIEVLLPEHGAERGSPLKREALGEARK